MSQRRQRVPVGLSVALAIALVACGGGRTDPASEQFVAASDAFAAAYQAAVESNPNQGYSDIVALFSALGSSTATFADSLRTIPFPDSASADAQALIGAVVIAQTACVQASRTPEANIQVAIDAAVSALTDVSSASAVLRSNLGIPTSP